MLLSKRHNNYDRDRNYALYMTIIVQNIPVQNIQVQNIPVENISRPPGW